MDLHRLIHCNLQQLGLYYPTSYSFSEGMFKVTNIRGFQETILYLLNIVDSARCKELIPFPLLDKKAETQFRIGVRTFLMEINNKYPVANLPKIVVSFLMNPGGDKFAHFMWKLTSFVLYKTVSEGREKTLLPPRILDSDQFRETKLTLLEELEESETRKALIYQLKLDSMASQKCEWECNLELNELNEKIRLHESKVKELIKAAPVPPSMMEKLLDLNNKKTAISEWTKEVELEGRTLEAMVHVVSKYSNTLAELNNTLALVESYKAANCCIDVDSIIECRNALDNNTKELFLTVQKGNISLATFMQCLNEILCSLLTELRSSESSECLNELASNLQALSKDFEHCGQEYITVENKLQKKLTDVRRKLDEILNEPSPEVSENEEIPPAVPDDGGDLYSPMSFTPVRGVYADIKKEIENCSNAVMDFGLIMTPELERSADTPVTSFKREIKTPISFSTNKSSSSKTNISDLRNLTGSLLKKKIITQLSEKKCRENIRTQPKPVTSKKLFDHGTGSSKVQKYRSHIPVSAASGTHAVKKEPVKFPSNLSEETEASWELLKNEIFNEEDEEVAGGFTSLIDDKDVRTSPSLLLSSTSTDDQIHTNKSCNRRKSLDAIIQRYLKVKKNMDC